MKVDSIRLELLEGRRGPGRAAWALAAIAVLFGADLTLRTLRLQTDVAAREVSVAEARRIGDKSIALPASLDREEEKFASETLRRLSTPWDALFSALERAKDSPVVLSAVEPDADNRRLSVSGEAKDYLAALSYVADLERQGIFTWVRLARHEARRGAVAFTIHAAWKDSL